MVTGGMLVHKKRYGQLFLSTLRLSACTFGGGFVIVALMRRRFVQEIGWIDEREMMDMTAIAQSAPGAVAVNASILMGYHTAGLIGAAVALLGAVLPPLVIISVISLFYQAFRESVLVSMVMRGMLAGVAAVIVDVVIGMASQMIRERRMPALLMAVCAFVMLRGFGIPVAAVLLICAALGLLTTLRKKGGKGHDSI